ncbi:MAG TPA: undecaprenyl-phosphate glucose phosphotransferase [Candidatus Binatia bacterium]|nr:undecaprenyl-phosphate glucose phosphotransferase [Candidatus Binatia bacterium]
MLARHRQLLVTGVFVLDAALIFASWVAAYLIRFHLLPLAAPLGIPPLRAYLWMGAVLTPVSLLVLRSFRLYRSARTARLSQELLAVLQAIAIVAALAALGSYFLRGEVARSVLLLFAVLAAFTLCLSRVAVRSALRALRRQGHNLRHVLIVGTGPMAAHVARKMAQHGDYGFQVHGFVSAAPRAGGSAEVGGLPVLGDVERLPELVEMTGAQLVYLALAREEHEAELLALERLSDSTAAVRLVPDLARAFTLNASVEDFDGMPVVLVTESPDQGWNSVLKRAFDAVFAGAGLLVLWPGLLAIAAWIKLDSRGPVFFAQDRVGLNGRRFRMLKFRTMVPEAESDGAQWTKKDDPRRTRAGAVLRKLSLDELPQLWNVFVGDMSLVGPRPEQPLFVHQFRASVPRYMLRHHVKAGITGWAQVNGLRGDTPLERRIEYDLYYIEHWSMAFDLKILALTVVRLFRDPSAV